MKGQKFGVTLVEILIMVAIIGLLLAVVIPTCLKTREDNLKKDIRSGKLIQEPIKGLVYTVTAIDSNSNTVIAIPHDSYYSSNTLHRVLLRVNEDVRFIGAIFACSNDGKYHLMTLFTNFQTKGWVEAKPQ